MHVLGIEVQVDDLVVAAAQAACGDVGACLERLDGLGDQLVFGLAAAVSGQAELHAAKAQVAKQLAGQRGDGGKVAALDIQFAALAPGNDVFTLLVIHRVAAAAAAADADILALACGFQTGIEAQGNGCGQFGRVAVLVLGVEGHLHGVMIDRLLDLGLQGNLVVTGLVGLGGAGQQAATEQQAGQGQKQCAHGVLLMQC